MPDLVPVDQVVPGDTLVLPSKRRATVERVDLYEDDSFVVRWRRVSGDHPWGVQLGSLAGMHAGELVQVER